MKVRASVKPLCDRCKVIREAGRVARDMQRQSSRHKQRQG